MSNRASASSRAFAAMTALFERVSHLSEFGTQGYPLATRRRLMVVNLTIYLISIFSFLFAIQFLLTDAQKFLWLAIAHVIVGFVMLLAPLAHRINDIAAASIVAIIEFIILFLLVMCLGRESGIQIDYLIAAAIPFVIFGLERLWLVVITIVTGLALHVTTWFLFPQEKALIQADPALLNNLYVSSVITTGCILAVLVFYAFSLAEQARREADNLLLSILPEPIAERLKREPGERIADSVPQAAVLFTDLVGFTRLTRKLDPDEMLLILDEIFSAFDKLAASYGIEKIRTIGDGYMSVCGVVNGRSDHTEQLALFALELPKALKEISQRHGRKLQIRVGMSVGPMLAGVIGADKPAFDVWGEAVNLAARLEASSRPGRVHVCPTVKRELEPLGTFVFEPRERVELKGIGKMETFLLKAPSRRATA